MPQVSQKEKAKLWLSQFDQGPGDRKLAEKLLYSVNYCPLNEFKDSLVKLARNVLPPWQPSALLSSVSCSPPKQSSHPRCTSIRKPTARDQGENMTGLTGPQSKRSNQSDTKHKI